MLSNESLGCFYTFKHFKGIISYFGIEENFFYVALFYYGNRKMR